MRIISGAKSRDHTDPLFKKLNVLSLENIHEYKICLFMYKFYHKELPRMFDNMFTINYNNTRQRRQLKIPFAKLESLRRTVRIKGVHIWNKCFKQYPVNCCIHIFGKHIRKYLIQS